MKLPSLDHEGNPDLSSIKWVQNIVTCQTHNASDMSSDMPELLLHALFSLPFLPLYAFSAVLPTGHPHDLF